jgi:hypothetical protein
MANVTCIGGVFFKSEDPKRLTDRLYLFFGPCVPKKHMQTCKAVSSSARGMPILAAAGVHNRVERRTSSIRLGCLEWGMTS